MIIHQRKFELPAVKSKFNHQTINHRYLSLVHDDKFSGEKVCGYGRAKPDCDTCLLNYYSTNCSKYCVDSPGQQSCNKSTGEKTCLGNWIGDCDTCKSDYYGSNCSVYCVAVPGKTTFIGFKFSAINKERRK